MHKDENGIRMSTNHDDIVQVREGQPAYRILVGFYDHTAKGGDILIKNYFVWLTADSEVVKKTQDGSEPTIDDYCWSALSEVARRFEESGYRVPDENGLDASTTTAESKTIVDAANYIHPVEKVK